MDMAMAKKRNNKEGFALIEIVFSIALFAMVALLTSQLMMLQHKRVAHIQTIVQMARILEIEKAQIISGRQDLSFGQREEDYVIEKEVSLFQSGNQDLINFQCTKITVTHKKTGMQKELVVVTQGPEGEL